MTLFHRKKKIIMTFVHGDRKKENGHGEMKDTTGSKMKKK
jgi:hypothetical protein